MYQILQFAIIVLSYLCKFIVYRAILSLDELLCGDLQVAAYIGTVAASVGLASVIFLGKKKYPDIILMCIMDVWMLANIIYYQANFIWIDWQVIVNADQIRGFESSIISYLNWKQLLFPLITVLTVFAVFRVSSNHRKERCWGTFCVAFGSAIFLGLVAWGVQRHSFKETENVMTRERLFIKSHSPLAHLARVTEESVREIMLNRQATQPLTTEEKQILSSIYTDSVTATIPQGHLVYILVESFESWALKVSDIMGRPVCPNLNKYIREHDILFSENVISQQLYGRSGDGQLITQTGMLPISHGVACMRYGQNRYPNLAHFYPDGVVLNPYPKVWNQAVTTYSYGFQRLREPPHLHIHEKDSTIFEQAREELENAVVPTCILAITIDTHVPFLSVPTTMKLNDSYSLTENRYLQSVHYFDKHVGHFLAWADTAAIMQNATIVITADHNHFPRKNGKGVCPLIIRSPSITRKTIVPEAYQMDIFPTVLHAIGQNNYAWHGFGIDLLDSTAVRSITPQQAYSLSDKMIRTDYFK